MGQCASNYYLSFYFPLSKVEKEFAQKINERIYSDSENFSTAQVFSSMGNDATGKPILNFENIKVYCALTKGYEIARKNIQQIERQVWYISERRLE
jgi:hypothetical protein